MRLWPWLPSMQCACAILSSVACPTLLRFSTLSHKLLDFRKKVTEYKMCILIFSTNFVSNISHSKKNWARCDQKCILVDVKHPILLSDFNENWLFSIDFRKILIYKISWKSVQWEPSCFMRTDGQTCRTTRMKRVVGFHNFANEPKNYFWIGR